MVNGIESLLQINENTTTKSFTISYSFCRTHKSIINRAVPSLTASVKLTRYYDQSSGFLEIQIAKSVLFCYSIRQFTNFCCYLVQTDHRTRRVITKHTTSLLSEKSSQLIRPPVYQFLKRFTTQNFTSSLY